MAELRTLVAVSSQTGNTWKAGRYVHKGAGTAAVLARTQELADKGLQPEDFDCVMVGFWLDSGHVDNDSLALLHSLHGKKVALFGTLGGNPKSPEAKKVMDTAVEALGGPERGNMCLGTLWLQGKISQQVLNMMYERFPGLKDDPAHKARIAAAQSHPDAQDRLKALWHGEYWQRKACRS